MYIINSTKCSITEYNTVKHWKLYDLRFRVIEEDGTRVQKHFNGFRTKAEAKQFHAQFLQEQCVISTDKPKAPKPIPYHNSFAVLNDYVNR